VVTDLLIYALGGLICGSPGLVLMAVIGWRSTR
jgi:hypothetical protein